MWEPAGKRYFDTGAPALFMEQMSRAGLDLPRILTDTDILILRGMAAVSDSNHFDEIIEVIKQHGAIRLWAS